MGRKSLFLLDAYALIYRAYYAFINTPRINSKGFNTGTILGFTNTLEEVIRKNSPDYMAVAFDPKGPTFRHLMFEEYKAQRDETPEVIRESVPIIKEVISSFNIPILEVEGYEADDVIGTMALKASEIENLDTYMLTPDKDYCQLVKKNVFVYKPLYGEKGYATLGIEEVLEKYGIKSPEQVIDLLGLMGDASDNIPGCPGVGIKTATKLIEEFGNIENLLDSVENLRGALKKKISDNMDSIRLSKYLATIKTDVPIELNLESLKRRELDKEKLSELFQRLEFKSLFKKMFDLQHEDNLWSLKDNTGNVTKKETAFQADLFDIFKADGGEDFKYSNLRDLNSTSHAYYFIDNESRIAEICTDFLSTEEISFKLITDGGPAIDAEIKGVAISKRENESYFMVFPNEVDKKRERLELIRPIFENNRSLKVGHNLKYDMVVLGDHGIEVRGELFDTMVAHYILQPELNHELSSLSETYLKYRTTTYTPVNETRTLFSEEDSRTDYYEYACECTDLSLQLKNELKKELEKDSTVEVAEQIEMPLIRVLAYMERNGARVDRNSLRESSELVGQNLKAIEKEIFEMAGTTFNILSPKQVGEILFDRLKISDKAKKTKKGQYVTSEEVLMDLKGANPIVGLILKYRGLSKLISTYIESLPNLINRHSGKIHTTFNQTVTATGRLSSSNPNLQNIPIRNEDGKEIRRAFIPDDDCTFFSADYSQIELRIMAHLSGDEGMISDFLQGHDIHAATAAKVFHKPIEEITKSERSKAKTANFGIIYGISAFGLANRMGVSRSEAKELIENYFITYPKIKSYMEKSIEMAREKGYIETIYKRKRYLPDINSQSAVTRGYSERNAINAPIQGSAADIIKRAMVGIYNKFMQLGLKSTMIIQVHDELNFCVAKGEEEVVKKIVKDEMENAITLLVPLTIDCGFGTNWLEAH